jgi:hypothetical protein
MATRMRGTVTVTCAPNFSNFSRSDPQVALSIWVCASAIRRRAAGWTPSIGSAMGFVGAVWLEFHYLAPLAAAATGVLYGSVWKRSKRSAQSRVFYIMLVALSVYLVMQDTDAWLYRVVMFDVLPGQRRGVPRLSDETERRRARASPRSRSPNALPLNGRSIYRDPSGCQRLRDSSRVARLIR